jgi:hypothetical protein
LCTHSLSLAAFERLENRVQIELRSDGAPPELHEPDNLSLSCRHPLLACNAVSLVKAALRSADGCQQVNEEVSSYYQSLEIGRTYDGMMIAIPALRWAPFRELSAKEFANALRELASTAKLLAQR